jgi:hypothetical protein
VTGVSNRDVEREAITAFFVNPKRQRLLTMLDDPKGGRGALIAELPHTRSLDERWLREIPPKDQTAVAIERLLREEGASGQCWAISEDDQIDGQSLPLAAALDRVVGWGSATLLICERGLLAYYEGEEAGDRYILKRTR